MMTETFLPTAPTGDAALLAIAMGRAEGFSSLSSHDIDRKFTNIDKSFPPNYTMLIVTLVVTCINVVFMFLRWWACWRCKRFMLEDWLMVPACVFTCALAANTSRGMLVAGLGKHIWQMTYDELRLLLPVVYAFMPIYILATFFTQLSVITFSFRITKSELFPNSRWIVRISLWHWIIWLPSTMTAFLLQCLPVEANYRLDLRFDSRTRCKDYIPLYTVVAFVHMAVDFALLAVPAHLVWRAKVPRRKKCVALVFLLIGLIASSFSIIRASFAVMYSRSADMAFLASWIAYCSQLELSLAMLTTSLPKLRPFFPSMTSSRIFSVSMGTSGRAGQQPAMGHHNEDLEMASTCHTNRLSKHEGCNTKEEKMDNLSTDEFQLLA